MIMFIPHHHFLVHSNTSSITDWLTAIGTLLLVVIAFSAFWGEVILRRIFKPKLISLEIKDTPQIIGSEEVVMYRLCIKNNTKWSSGKSVKAFVSSNSSADKSRFIPIPLNWTYIDGRKRDISSEEDVLLDLFQKTSTARYFWCWPHGSPTEPALSELLGTQNSEIRIQFYDEYSSLGHVDIVFDHIQSKASIVKS